MCIRTTTTIHVVNGFCQLPNKRICYVMLCYVMLIASMSDANSTDDYSHRFVPLAAAAAAADLMSSMY